MVKLNRIAAGLEYEGSAYHGWQFQAAQPQLPTVQALCEQALSQVANHPINIICAGRTDKGVHALHQVIHFDTSALRRPAIWVSGANHYLPADIRLLWAQPVESSFHARYSAVARTYHYLLSTASVRPALRRHQVSWCPGRLNIALMGQATQYLIGEHDFSAFRSAECQSKSAMRRLDFLEITQQADLIVFKIRANAFLHHMVRNIVGTLMAIGREKHPPEWMQQVLQSKKRSEAGITAPPQGLYLVRVDYTGL